MIYQARRVPSSHMMSPICSIFRTGFSPLPEIEDKGLGDDVRQERRKEEATTNDSDNDRHVNNLSLASGSMRCVLSFIFLFP